MKAKTYHVRFCTYFAGNNSRLRITLNFTNATNDYCKDEPCKGNLETSYLHYAQLICLSVCLYDCMREKGTIHSSRERDTFTEKNSYPNIFSNALKLIYSLFPSLSVRSRFTCYPYF